METPKAYILRQIKRLYVVRCPFCKSQHYHRIHGKRKNIEKNCVDERSMSQRERYNTKVAQMVYDNAMAYDLEWPHEEWKDSLYTNTYFNTSPLSN